MLHSVMHGREVGKGVRNNSREGAAMRPLLRLRICVTLLSSPLYD